MAETMWSRQDCFVRAFWARPGESPGWAADRVMALLGFVQARDASLGSSLLNVPWDGSRAELQRLFEELPVVDDHGRPTTAWGYADPGPLITGYEEPVRVSLSIGAPSVGRRIPLHKVSASVERLSPERTKALSESLFEGFVLAFDPLYVEMVTLNELLMWHRLSWHIRPGYRIWLNDVVGEFSWLADGMTSQRMGSGTVYSCPADWTSQQVVDAWKAVVERSGLDEIPRDTVQNMDVPDYLPVPDQVRIIAPEWSDEEESDEVTETPPPAEPTPTGPPPVEPASDGSGSGVGDSGRAQFVYRQQITGLRPNDEGQLPTWTRAYEVGDHVIPVRFHGRTLRDNDTREVFLMAFDDHEQLWREPWEPPVLAIMADLVSLASWQAESVPPTSAIEWHISTVAGATAIRNLLAQHGLATRINIILTPNTTTQPGALA
ncbi:hypothetical protein [Brevibacterium sp. HMSC07C04]|uniref:hypothetical protein n=1 Tax=Brevibacterium sp. HMSC07C04 TaxID=1581130 RepID=UPI00114CC408|nr:hypothetical protein [Brevibacterium sp. HMSC07C04]